LLLFFYCLLFIGETRSVTLYFMIRCGKMVV